MSEDPFGYVAGAESGAEYGSGEELETVMMGVGALMAWRTVPSFSATVVHERGADVRRFRLTVEPMRLAYSLVDQDSGTVDSYDAVTREYVVESEPIELDYLSLTPESAPARLAFPMSLLIWGRRQDNWRIVSGSRFRHEISLGLVSTVDPSVQGSLMIGRHSQMAVRLDTPTEKIWYESIEPHVD